MDATRRNEATTAGFKGGKSTQSQLWMIPHLLLLLVPAFVAGSFFNGTLFGYHPTFMSLGYMALLGQGILLASRAKGKNRDLFLWVHIACQVVGMALILCGLLAILQNKVKLGKPHFITVHSRFGLGTLILTAASAPGGLPNFYGLPPSWRKFRTLVNRTHRRIGRFAFAAALLTILTGLQTFNPAHPLHKGLLTYACAAGVAAAAVAVFGQSGLDSTTRKRLSRSFWGPRKDWSSAWELRASAVR